MAGDGGDGDSSERSAWEAASLVFRIATVGMSLASAIMTLTATSTRCGVNQDDAGAGGGTTVSSSDYGSFEYSAVADLASAVLQGAAICLEVVGKEKWAKAVELIDKVVVALTSTSTALLFAVDDVTSCGPPPRRPGQRRRSACTQAAEFCPRIRIAAVASLGAAISAAAASASRRATQSDQSIADETTPTDSPGSTPPRCRGQRSRSACTQGSELTPRIRGAAIGSLGTAGSAVTATVIKRVAATPTDSPGTPPPPPPGQPPPGTPPTETNTPCPCDGCRSSGTGAQPTLCPPAGDPTATGCCTELQVTAPPPVVPRPPWCQCQELTTLPRTCVGENPDPGVSTSSY